MKRNGATKDAKIQAGEALRALLARASSIKLREIRFDSPRAHGKVDILARVSVCGHSHTLVCTVMEAGQLQTRPIRAALRELGDHIAQLGPDATAALIAPYRSEEAQALCRESEAGYLDLEGNARLVVGEVFIATRSFPNGRAAQIEAGNNLELDRFATVAA
jgi:hypothetical protein